VTNSPPRHPCVTVLGPRGSAAVTQVTQVTQCSFPRTRDGQHADYDGDR